MLFADTIWRVVRLLGNRQELQNKVGERIEYRIFVT